MTFYLSRNFLGGALTTTTHTTTCCIVHTHTYNSQSHDSTTLLASTGLLWWCTDQHEGVVVYALTCHSALQYVTLHCNYWTHAALAHICMTSTFLVYTLSWHYLVKEKLFKSCLDGEILCQTTQTHVIVHMENFHFMIMCTCHLVAYSLIDHAPSQKSKKIMILYWMKGSY